MPSSYDLHLVGAVAFQEPPSLKILYLSMLTSPKFTEDLKFNAMICSKMLFVNSGKFKLVNSLWGSYNIVVVWSRLVKQFFGRSTVPRLTPSVRAITLLYQFRYG
jgi:hypothetical protein